MPIYYSLCRNRRDKSIENKMQTFVKKYSIANISNYKATIYREFRSINSNERCRFRFINSNERFRFRALNLSAVGSNSGKYYMKKKGDNIYLWALIILIIVIIFYIVKRLYK